ELRVRGKWPVAARVTCDRGRRVLLRVLVLRPRTGRGEAEQDESISPHLRRCQLSRCNFRRRRSGPASPWPRLTLTGRHGTQILSYMHTTLSFLTRSFLCAALLSGCTVLSGEGDLHETSSPGQGGSAGAAGGPGPDGSAGSSLDGAAGSAGMG